MLNCNVYLQVLEGFSVPTVSCTKPGCLVACLTKYSLQFHQLCTLAGRYKQNYCAGPPGIDSLESWNRFLGSLNKFCHEMNNFFEGLKNQISTFVYAPIVVKFFCCLIMEKLKDKVFACFQKNTNFENPFNNSLQTACCGIQEPALDSVNCSVSRR